MNWKPMPGFLGYEVSDAGEMRCVRPRNRNSKAISPRPLKTKDVRGYRCVTIRTHEQIKHTVRMARAVLLAFIGTPRPDQQACHNNGIKTDDRLENLRWDTASANSMDAVRHGTHPGLKRRGSKHPRALLTEEQVMRIKELIREGRGNGDIGKLFGVKRTTINSIKMGISWRHLDAMLAEREKQ